MGLSVNILTIIVNTISTIIIIFYIIINIYYILSLTYTVYRLWKCQFVLQQIYKFVQGHSQVRSAYWTDHCPRPTLLLWRFLLLPWEDISFLYGWFICWVVSLCIGVRVDYVFYALLSSCLNMVKNDYALSVSLPLQYFPGSTINSPLNEWLWLCALHVTFRVDSPWASSELEATAKVLYFIFSSTGCMSCQK